MAESPSHKFGQIIGNLLEEMILPKLLEFSQSNGLYVDSRGKRKKVRNGQKVSWEDKYGNLHDLDFVIEKNGTVNKRGRPVAFIEVAWRRYTKHSRNKAQEIQGAVLPIAEKYERDRPFLGAILAGIFTAGSLKQLKSVGFKVLYIPYETIINAFQAIGVNARFDEKTLDKDFLKCVSKVEALSFKKRERLKQELFEQNSGAFREFFGVLKQKLDRIIERIEVFPLFGGLNAFSTTAEAIKFIASFNSARASGVFQKYEVIVVYSNGDEIRGVFSTKEKSKEFLEYISV